MDWLYMVVSSQSLYRLGLLGSAGIVATLLILPDSLDAMSGLCGGYENVSIFLTTSLSTAVVVGFLTSLFGALCKQASLKGFGFGGLIAASALIAIRVITPMSSNGIIFVMLGVLFGAGLVAVAIQWGVAYSVLPQEKIVAWLSISCLIAVPLKSLAITFQGGGGGGRQK
jgi:hypothetical protein